MKVQTARAVALLCAFTGLGTHAAAQESADPFDAARFRLGAIHFTPALVITSLGHDSNVFNEADNPKSDTTAAVGPAVQLWMRPARTRLSAKLGAQYLYFKQYDNQRAWNTSSEARWEVPLSRFTPFIGGRYINSRERQGYEIDSRSRRRDEAASIGTSLRLSGKTSVVATFQQFDAKYDEHETFLGATLAQELNRREQKSELQLRYDVTPLTTFVVRGEMGRDRFRSGTLRNSDSVKVMPGFELKPLALISGDIFVGYRHFNALNAALPDYTGIAAQVNARYVRGATRLDLTVDRDLSYSYSVSHPYYALLDTGLTVTRRLRDSWEVVGRGSRQVLGYRQLAPVESSARLSDRGHLFGGGVGYRVGDTLRLGMDANYSTRRSEIEGRRDFDGLRVFGSIAYGIQQ
jgi:hypothetical protein